MRLTFSPNPIPILSTLTLAVAVDAAAFLLDGDERPLAVGDLPVENVVADDEDGGVLRGVVVKVAYKLPPEGHVSDPGLEVTLKRRVGGKGKDGMASSDDSKAHVRTAITHLHFYDCPLVSLSLATFYEELHGCFKLWKNTIRKKFSFKPQTARAQNKTVSRSGRFE